MSLPIQFQQGISDQPGVEKGDHVHKEVLHDHDVARSSSKEEAMHLAELTEEEKAVEKKLRRKIDSLIMPLVILV